MRVLDLGCHDGFIASWIGRKVPDLHVDGIDANVHAVAEFNRRATLHGIPGSAVVGLAEDARAHFETGTYDAVVAFELIEHVPDVDLFLTRCEEMLAPGGTIYLSTPDGTFGEGQNPHHLRVYRTIDLCEVVRRRGELTDARVGPDGIMFIAYRPRSLRVIEQPEAHIFTGPSWKPWHPMQIEMPGGLGGSETAAVRLAERLSDAGWLVTIYGDFHDQGMFKQVALRHYSLYDPFAPVELLVVSRMPQVVDMNPKAKVKLLWMHDVDCGDTLTDVRADKYDRLLVLSEWQRGHVMERYPFLDAEDVYVWRNAVEPAYFRRLPAVPERVRHGAIFSSSPDRGLDFLLDLWPDVLEHVPDATLHYAYADVYEAVSASGQRPEVTLHHQKIREAAAALGDRVVNLGALSQVALPEVMQSVGLWLHPSWNAPSNGPFMETFCIGALEAFYSGCRIVSSDWGALKERPATRRIPLLESGALDRGKWVTSIVNELTLPASRSRLPDPDRESWFNAVAELQVLVVDLLPHPVGLVGRAA